MRIDKTPVTYSMLQNKLRSRIKQIGLDPEEFSSHSFRRGFATFAFNESISADHIQLLGDWKSDSYNKRPRWPKIAHLVSEAPS